jgi:5-methylthioadenosine/S-adenosylhomocysteine deaminase
MKKRQPTDTLCGFAHNASEVLVTRTAITNATIVTVDAHDTVIHGGTIVIADNTIVEVLPAGMGPATPCDHTIDAGGGIVMPGLINAHTHLAMTAFRGFADDVDLQDFLGKLFPAEAKIMSDRHVRVGVRAAFAEAMLSGCTAALDMYWHSDASIEEAVNAGFRLQTGPIFIGSNGPDNVPFEQRLSNANASKPHSWILAHGTYTMDPTQLAAVGELATSKGARFHIHASENAGEVADVQGRYGRTPVELLDDHGLLRDGTVLAHAVVLTDAEIARLAETHTAVAHCPSSNMKLASGFCRVPELLAAGVTVGLGTDGPSSSNDLDMFTAMRVAALIHKGNRLDPTIRPASSILRMATMGSAMALGIDQLVGSIEVGKKADLVRLDPSSPSLTPIYDPISAVVYAASRADVVDVWIDGQAVVRNRTCTTIDLNRVLSDLRDEGRAINE